MNGPDRPMALSLLLDALACEIDTPRAAILAAENHLSAWLQGGRRTADAARDLQNIDLALQTLDDLQGVLRRLASSLTAEFLVDAHHALQGLRLERVAANLSGANGQAPPPPTQPLVELF